MAALPFMVTPHPLPSISSGNEREEKPALHLAQFKHIGMTWRTAGNASIWARGDFGQARAVDFVALLQANALASALSEFSHRTFEGSFLLALLTLEIQ